MERFGLLILPPVEVKVGQVIEVIADTKIIGAIPVLVNGQGMLIEWLGFLILGIVIEIGTGILKKNGCLGGEHGPLLDIVNPEDGGGEISLKHRPGGSLLQAGPTSHRL